MRTRPDRRADRKREAILRASARAKRSTPAQLKLIEDRPGTSRRESERLVMDHPKLRGLVSQLRAGGTS